MNFKVDFGISRVSKHHEEVCGDTVVVIRDVEATTVIFSDGLGSGIKASILSILTTKIVAGLLRRKVGLEQVFATIADTLPTCKVRNLAYSTLSILRIANNGEAHLIEYDNPELLLLREGALFPIERKKRVIASKDTMEAFFTINTGDILLLLSDGVINAGVGGLFQLGLGYQGVVTNLMERRLFRKEAEEIAAQIINLVDACYLCQPRDDATAVVMAARKLRRAMVLTGPPVKKEWDRTVVNRLMSATGMTRIVSGGATGNLVARETGKKISVGLEYEDPSVPPLATIEGVDLVTEGILTLNKCVTLLKKVANGGKLNPAKDGATVLAKKLLEADQINFLVGTASNPAHQEFMKSLQLKVRTEAIAEMQQLLSDLGKEVITERF